MIKHIIFFIIFATVSCKLLAHPGIGIVKDSKGNVFYTDLVHVWKIAVNGKRTIAVQDVHTHQLYMDNNDNLYGEHEWYEGERTNRWRNYVWCLTSSGEFKKIIPDVIDFLENDTLVRDEEGNSYWTEKNGNHQILKQTNTQGKIKDFSIHRFHNIRWKYFSKNDQCLYVIDHLSVKKVSPKGEVTLISDQLKDSNTKPFSGVADRHYLFGMWTDKNASLYVAVFGAAKVKKIDSQGNTTTVFTSEKGWSPCGGFIDDDGTHWIMEFSNRNNARIHKINKRGEHTIYGD